ncbi:ComEA family DNA-binding protein [Cellulosimicrobium cellulans]|uniref:ComEA family DNA-binding protein n=1 Tax=Cellulosimicrobium cellulans TaxID=1710 RepID=UPI001FCC2051|nr:helix-hairpin-helix domain-containing protein [Cellulosimicrobium cellulans]
MSTPRPEPRQHARPGRDPAREGAVVRQRLRAVTGTGRPALAWHPATAALPQGGPPDDPDVGPWPGGLRPSALGPGDGAGPAPGGEVPALPGVPAAPDGAERHGRGRARGSGDRAAGWLPPRPDVDEGQGVDLAGEPGTGDDEPTAFEGADAESVDRLRSRAAQTASTAYTAAYGHPTSHAGFAGLGEEGRRRWALRPRVAVTSLVVVLLLTAAVVLVRTPAGGVTPVASLDAAPTAGAATGPDAEPAISSDADEAVGSAAREAAGADDAGASTGADGVPSDGVVVHVVGQVVTPGLVTVAADARVADALEAAGGATADADLAALNLARTVTDGEQIVVPRPGEAVPATGSAPPAAGTAADGTVDLNTADAAALDALPGIGPVLAERIVAWREENGPFTTVDELGEVSGIGPAVLADVRDLVRV